MTTTQTTTQTTPVTVTPAVKEPTVAELATAHAAYEVRRVKAAAAAAFDGHPMAVSEPTWEYIADLLRDAYQVGVAKGADLHMADINRRYTLTGRR